MSKVSWSYLPQALVRKGRYCMQQFNTPANKVPGAVMASLWCFLSTQCFIGPPAWKREHWCPIVSAFICSNSNTTHEYRHNRICKWRISRFRVLTFDDWIQSMWSRINLSLDAHVDREWIAYFHHPLRLNPHFLFPAFQICSHSKVNHACQKLGKEIISHRRMSAQLLTHSMTQKICHSSFQTIEWIKLDDN